jgi:alpha-amylase
LGFDAIWISPIVENTEGGYHGYWAKDIWKLNDKFGKEEDL